LTAAEAHPVWLLQTERHSLRLTAQTVNEASRAAPGVLLAALPNLAHILIDTLGRQHSVVRCGAAHMHLVVNGQPVVIAPVILSACVDERDAIGPVAQRLARLERLLSASPDAAITRWTAETLRLRDALIALDGHLAGATLPEIAAVIYGQGRIERDWPGKGLRQRVRRAQLRGIALCNGGYRDLLR
jgi:hypothetical protein